MEPVTRKIEASTDATGRQRCTVLRTITVQDSQALDRILQRLDKSQALVGCANVLCHLEHWTEGVQGDWSIKIRCRHLPTLRMHLAQRQLEQEELICLSSDGKKASEQLRAYQNTLRFSDKELLALGLDVCRGLTEAAKCGIEDCTVSADTLYRSAGGKWLVGHVETQAEGPVGTAGLAQVLHQLLGGTDHDAEPPLGTPELRKLVKQAREKEMELPVLQKRLEWLAGYRPEPEQKPTPPPVEKKAETWQAAAGINRFATPQEKEPVQPPMKKKADTWQAALENNGYGTKPKPPVEKKPYTWQASAGINRFAQPQKKPNDEESLSYLIRKKVHLSAMLSAGDGFTAAVRRNGTVSSTRIFAGLAGWTGIKAVSVGGSHMLGLREDGRVCVVGSSFHGQCDVGKWSDIIQVAAGACYSAGLRSDGTLLVAGWIHDTWQQNAQWRNIAAISAGNQHLVGLRPDGTVVAAGNTMQGRCDVGSWKSIVSVAAGGMHTVGLRQDGTVVATGANLYGQCNVGGWTDIVAVDAGADHTVGLKSDGTVVAVGNFSFGACAVGEWNDIIAISAGWSTTVGLRSNGMLVAKGKNDYGQCDVAHWRGLI